MPIYLNTINNAILRSAVPSHDPATYGKL